MQEDGSCLKDNVLPLVTQKNTMFWVSPVSRPNLEQTFRRIDEQLHIPNLTESKSDMEQL